MLSDGSVDCWGLSILGQLGDGTRNWSNVPVAVAGISNATAVSTGGESSCAMLVGQSIKCWGANYYGALGDGTNTNSNLAVRVRL